MPSISYRSDGIEWVKFGKLALKALLSSNQDTLHLARVAEQEKKELNKSVQGYVRGSDYYSGGDKS